jgi:hypothetical protein
LFVLGKYEKCQKYVKSLGKGEVNPDTYSEAEIKTKRVTKRPSFPGFVYLDQSKEKSSQNIQNSSPEASSESDSSFQGLEKTSHKEKDKIPRNKTGYN